MQLYENAFYGKQGGVILESGAAEGDIFSITYMVEEYSGSSDRMDICSRGSKSLQLSQSKGK